LNLQLCETVVEWVLTWLLPSWDWIRVELGFSGYFCISLSLSRSVHIFCFCHWQRHQQLGCLAFNKLRSEGEVDAKSECQAASWKLSTAAARKLVKGMLPGQRPNQRSCSLNSSWYVIKLMTLGVKLTDYK